MPRPKIFVMLHHLVIFLIVKKVPLQGSPIEENKFKTFFCETAITRALACSIDCYDPRVKDDPILGSLSLPSLV
jgi:hypothetical protein